MSEGMQIEIPTFDDDDYNTGTIPFGKSGGGHGFGNPFGQSSNPFGQQSSASSFGQAANSNPFGQPASSNPFGQGNPFSATTVETPLAMPDTSSGRAGIGTGGSYFGSSHSRGDSVTSIDSTNSIGTGTTRYTTATTSTAKSSFNSHSNQSSIAASSTGTPFSKKPSFASIRNAFKSGSNKNNAASHGADFTPPPVPSINGGLMKDSFNRSTSSLSQYPTSRPVTGRPPTPGGSASKTSSRSGHTYKQSLHTTSDNVSDFSTMTGSSTLVSPPPVPRMPDAFGMRSDTPDMGNWKEEEDKVQMDPKTPADFALHAVFMRFAASAEGLIDVFLRIPMDADPTLPTFLGPGKDPKFDETLNSLGKIATKNAKAVVDSIMRWRRTQNDNTGYADIIKAHAVSLTSPPPQSSLNGAPYALPPPPTLSRVRPADVPGIVHERKSLASIYIMCRALVSVLKLATQGSLGDGLGYALEETTFDTLRKPDLRLMLVSANHRVNAALFSEMLGYLANVRFTSVTDRFLAELEPLAADKPIPKEVEMKFENLVRGLRHVKIKVWPPEAFEEGAEFLETLSHSFVHAHGSKLKTAFAETLVDLLHPIGKTAQAETNIPQWAKAIETMHPKAKEMMSKPRYWSSAWPLVVTLLCVAPREYFLKHWAACWETGASKLKDRSNRVPVMNGLLRLIWTYLYRCQDSPSTAQQKLDGLLRTFFPQGRFTIFPPEAERLELFVYMVHFVLSRHFEYGTDLVLELMQESTVLSASGQGSIGSVFAPERTSIAVHAVLLSLSLIEHEKPNPTWPSSSDFSEMPGADDYPSSAEFRPALFSNKALVVKMLERTGAVLGKIAGATGKTVGTMSVFEEQWSAARLAGSNFEESPNYVMRKHPQHSGTGAMVQVAYPNHLAPLISLMQSCFESWPRCLLASGDDKDKVAETGMGPSMGEAVDMLLRGLVHVEPQLAEVSAAALMRFVSNSLADCYGSMVVERATTFIFHPSRLTLESTGNSAGNGIRLLVESRGLLDIWVRIVDKWVSRVVERPLVSEAGEDVGKQVERIGADLESAAVFLLGHEITSIRNAGSAVVKTLRKLVEHLASSSEQKDTTSPLKFVELLHGKSLNKAYLSGYDDILDKADLARLTQWKETPRLDVPLRIAESTNDRDRKIWRHIYPAFLHQCAEYDARGVLIVARESVVAAVSKYHPSISHLAGLSSRVPAGLSSVSTTKPGTGGMDRDGLRLLRENKGMIDQWCIWVKILCTTAVMPKPTQRGEQHSRAPSDGANFERERLSTTRGLFRYLTPFLNSEYTLFRDAAVYSISAFPPSAYPQLLDDLSPLAGRQLFDDPRNKPATSATVVVEQNINVLNARQLHGDDARLKAAGMGDRMRRQERLITTVSRIYYHTTPHLQQQRAAGRQAALMNILKFIRNMQGLLSSPEAREDHTFQRLRRFFCGTIERLFNGMLSTLDFERFMPQNPHLTLYRLCEEWCQFGPQPESVKQRLAAMQRNAAGSARQAEVGDSTEMFQSETAALSYAAVGSLAVLVQKAYFPTDMGSASPTERAAPEYSRPLTAASILERFSAIMGSSNPPTQSRGKKAINSLLSCPTRDEQLLTETLRRSVVTERKEGSDSRIFEVVAEIVTKSDRHSFTFAQVVCLGLSNLCHPLSNIRRMSFNMLETIHQQSAGLLTMSQFEASVGSLAPTTYVHGHRLISDFLACEHPHEAFNVLVQVASWLPQLPDASNSYTITLLLLQSLEGWVSNLDLMTEDKSGLSHQGRLALYHLISISLRYAKSHMEQILALWTKLVEPPYQSNGHATVRFLVEHSAKVSNVVFIDCAANIVACLCQSDIGRPIFEDLISLVEPARMLATMDHKLTRPDDDDLEMWSDLDALFEGQPRIPQLGSAQYAWLFLADVAMPRYWEMKLQLPVLLHAIFIHLDHKTPFVRIRAQRMLFQLLRAWGPGYDELSDRSNYPMRTALKQAISELDRSAQPKYWKEEDSSEESGPTMKWLCSEVLHFLRPLAPSIAEDWGSLALHWGTTCSIRPIAFRSLQVFRALAPQVTERDLSLLLGRLSNTVAGPNEPIQLFTLEIIATLVSVASRPDLDPILVPKLYWCALACLSTTAEREFAQVLVFLEALIPKIDFDDATLSQYILTQQPVDWNGSMSLQSALVTGLRSSVTSAATLRVLKTLAQFKDNSLIEPTHDRVRDLYTLSLPWCLNNMSVDNPDPEMYKFAENIRLLAEREGRLSIQKIMNSFVKSHFRTKDDFLRQSVSSLREHYGADHWTEIVTLLLSLALNSERSLRTQVLNIVKVLFQQRETRNPVQLFGSELLMPLLRLLETDLAQQALDVLEEPIVMMSGGAPAKQVLRMSMHARVVQNEVDLEATVFGVPEESGWCIAKADVLRSACQSNVMAVFDTCSMTTRPSRVDFQPEAEVLASVLTPAPTVEDDLGGLVQNLHELTSFFQAAATPSNNKSRVMHTPNRRLEARVAAILAKSTATDNSVHDVPQTPFVDVFRVGGGSSSMEDTSDDSGEYSDSESEADAFMYDQPVSYRNGSRLR